MRSPVEVTASERARAGRVPPPPCPSADELSPCLPRRELRRPPQAWRPHRAGGAADGGGVASDCMPRPPAMALVLIDPPFEAADDYAAIVQAVRAVLRANRKAVIAVWLPIKDLTTYDGFVGALEDAIGETPALMAEARLRPL